MSIYISGVEMPKKDSIVIYAFGVMEMLKGLKVIILIC